MRFDIDMKSSGSFRRLLQPETMVENSYRDILIETGQKAQGEYDRVIAAVSGGALVVSFHFVGQANQPLNATGYAILAWIAWGLSLTAVLVSHLISVRTCERMREQVDRGQTPSAGWSPVVLWTTNIAGAVFFILGAGGFGIFVLRNLSVTPILPGPSP